MPEQLTAIKYELTIRRDINRTYAPLYERIADEIEAAGEIRNSAVRENQIKNLRVQYLNLQDGEKRIVDNLRGLRKLAERAEK